MHEVSLSKPTSYMSRDTSVQVVVKRGKTSCKALIALSLEYPVIPPFVVLEITSPGGKANSSNDKNIR